MKYTFYVDFQSAEMTVDAQSMEEAANMAYQKFSRWVADGGEFPEWWLEFKEGED